MPAPTELHQPHLLPITGQSRGLRLHLSHLSVCVCFSFLSTDHKDHVFVGSLWCQHFGWKWQLRIPPLWLCLWSCLAQWAAECGVNTVRVRGIVHNGIIPVRRETSGLWLLLEVIFMFLAPTFISESSAVGAIALPGAVGVPDLVWQQQQQPSLWGWAGEGRGHLKTRITFFLYKMKYQIKNNDCFRALYTPMAPYPQFLHLPPVRLGWLCDPFSTHVSIFLSYQPPSLLFTLSPHPFVFLLPLIPL